MKNKKIFITGGTGFIGKNLINELLKHDPEHINVFAQNIPLDLENKFNQNEKVSFIRGDVTTIESIEKWIEPGDIVFHLAAHADVSGAYRDPVLSFKVSALGTVNALKAAINKNVDKFIYISSARVYGDPIYRPIDEKHPLQPKEIYGGAKLAGDIMTSIFHKTYGLNTTILRVFSIYGPWRFPKNDTSSGVIPLFVSKIMNNEPLTIMGDGKQTKDFINVHDVIQALMLSAEKNTNGEVFNIGTGKATSINELARIIMDLIPNKSKIINIPSKSESVSNVADISKARKYLGYSPIVPLKEGLIEYIEWYKKNER